MTAAELNNNPVLVRLTTRVRDFRLNAQTETDVKTVDAVLKAWNAAGFDATAVENIEPGIWQAGSCSRGMVASLDVLLCEYAADEALANGEKKVMTDWQAENVPTGAIVRTSRTLLAVSDPNKVDPTGKIIAGLIKTFRDQK